MKKLTTFLLILFINIAIFAQTEVLTNEEIILMTQAGLSKDLIVRKIKESKVSFDVTTKSLIALKKAGVSDTIIKLMMDSNSNKATSSTNTNARKLPTSKIPFYQSKSETDSRIVITPKEALRNAKTIAIKKSSLHPSRQALEKELLKRKEWKSLNLNIVRYKNDADLLIEIGYVSMSWITHRYVYRIFDNKSGTVIAAGETTSWGSLSGNLARGISKRLKKVSEKTD